MIEYWVYDNFTMLGIVRVYNSNSSGRVTSSTTFRSSSRFPSIRSICKSMFSLGVDTHSSGMLRIINRAII